MDDKNETLGQAIDRLESITYSIQLPLSADLHLEALRGVLPEIHKQLKEGFIEATGENPWS